MVLLLVKRRHEDALQVVIPDAGLNTEPGRPEEAFGGSGQVPPEHVGRGAAILMPEGRGHPGCQLFPGKLPGPAVNPRLTVLLGDPLLAFEKPDGGQEFRGRYVLQAREPVNRKAVGEWQEAEEQILLLCGDLLKKWIIARHGRFS